MRFEYDLSSAPVLKPVNDGVYLLQIISSKEGTNDKGNQFINWEFKIAKPEELLVDNEKVETLYYRQYISKTEPQKSLGFIRDLFKACDKLVSGQGYFDTTDLYGCFVGAEIVKTAGTPEFPNPQNVVKKWFNQNNMPEPQVKPQD
jgi:hypothetical protein